jgi:hypothetical protein
MSKTIKLRSLFIDGCEAVVDSRLDGCIFHGWLQTDKQPVDAFNGRASKDDGFLALRALTPGVMVEVDGEGNRDYREHKADRICHILPFLCTSGF